MDCYNTVGSSNLNLCCWSRLVTSGWDLVARLEGECLILLAVMEEIGLWRISKMGFSFAATAVLLFSLARLVWLMENVFSLLCRWAPAAQWQAVPHHPDVHSRGRFLLWRCVTGLYAPASCGAGAEYPQWCRVMRSSDTYLVHYC